MFVADQDFDAFRRWTAFNRIFWQPYLSAADGADDGKAIYVDLFHDNIDYCLRNLLTARLLGLKLRRPVIGLTGSVGIVPTACSHLSIKNLDEIAQSFGVTLAVLEPEGAETVFTDLLEGALGGAGLDVQTATGAALRAFLTGWCLEDGFALGRLVYDTVLRSHLIETIDTIDARLIAAGASILAVRANLARRFEASPPAAVVTGHVDYSPYALLAEEGLNRGAGCIYIRNEGLMRLYFLYGRLKPGQTLLGRIREQSTKWQMRQQIEMISRNRRGLELHGERVASSLFYRSMRAVDAPCVLPPPDVRQTARAAILSHAGLDPARPTVGLFSITFSDIAVTDVQVFDDNYQWLDETLAFAVTQPGINWVVRIHPHDPLYNVTGAMRRLCERYGQAPNIRFFDGEGPPLPAFIVADSVSTIRGTPGLQAAQLGIPVVLCGRGFYSDLGIAEVAGTREVYFRRLVEIASETSDMSLHKVMAMACQYGEDVAFSLPSTFTGPFGDGSAAGFWERMSSRLAYYSPDSDPFAQGLYAAIDADAPRLSLARTESIAPSGAAPQPEGASVISFAFCAAATGVMRLFGGYSPESAGTWLAEGRAGYLLCLPHALTGKVSVTVHCRPFIHNDSPMPELRVTVNGKDSAPVALEPGPSRDYSLDIAMDGLAAGYVFVEFTTSGGTSPQASGLSDDARHLTVGLVSLTVATAA